MLWLMWNVRLVEFLVFLIGVFMLLVLLGYLWMKVVEFV